MTCGTGSSGGYRYFHKTDLSLCIKEEAQNRHFDENKALLQKTDIYRVIKMESQKRQLFIKEGWEMSAAGKTERCRRRKDPGRKGRAGAVPALYTTMGCSKKEEAIMYNDSEDVLILAGLDPEKMEFLPAAERKRLLEDAGLDPGEFDF
jgi:hypothetical protein